MEPGGEDDSGEHVTTDNASQECVLENDFLLSDRLTPRR